MTKYLVEEQTLTDIADAIREQTGDENPIQLSSFANEIGSIQGGGSVNYSTTEHEVGTWIDGSTVYEKTVDVAQYNVTASSSQWSDVFPVSDIDMIVEATVHKESPNVGQFLMFRANNGYIQVASNTSVNLTLLVYLPVTFKYIKSAQEESL